MANNNLENEQEQTFGSNGNYHQGFSSAKASSRPAKIVSPNLTFNRGFNAASASRSNERRKKEELPPDTKESNVENEMPKKNLGDRIKDKAIDVASEKLPPGLKGIGKNAMKKVLNDGSISKVEEAVFKVQKMKLYLIAGSIFFGFLLFIAIVFAVTSTGGTEASGAGFNEVSEYELEQDDEEVTTDENTDPGDTEEPVQPDIKGEGNEGLTQ